MQKQNTTILFLLLFACSLGLKAQLIGSEQTVAKQLYTDKFTVAGDKVKVKNFTFFYDLTKSKLSTSKTNLSKSREVSIS